MALLWFSGWELNQTGNNQEWTSLTGSPATSSSVFRSGAYSAHMVSMTSATKKGWQYTINTSNQNGPYFHKFNLRVDTPPSAENVIWALVDTTGFTGNKRVYMTLGNDSKLRLYDEDGQIGSASAALVSGFENCVEIKYDRSGSAGAHVVEARLNLTVFATSSTRDISTGIQSILMGANLADEAQTAGDWYFDDYVLNNATGSFINTYIGICNIKHLKPNGDGDNHDWLKSGGGAGDANNYQEVDEITPDDSTTYLKATAQNAIDDYNIEASGLGLQDAILAVAVSVRMRLDAATGGLDGDFTTRIKASSGGTVEELAAGNYIPNSTSWRTNNRSVGSNPKLILYDLPGASTTKWRSTDLETTQIGIKQLIASAVDAIGVSQIYLQVLYVPNQLIDVEGALAFGEQTPTNSEFPVSFQTFTNGAGAVPSISGDPDWGKLSLPTGIEARSKVYDFADSNPRLYTINRDVYGTGSGSATIKIRGSNTIFAQDDASPSWTTYTVPTLQSWRYVQIQVVGA